MLVYLPDFGTIIVRMVVVLPRKVVRYHPRSYVQFKTNQQREVYLHLWVILCSMRSYTLDKMYAHTDTKILSYTNTDLGAATLLGARWGA